MRMRPRLRWVLRPATWLIANNVDRLTNELREACKPYTVEGYVPVPELTEDVLRNARGWELLRDVEDQPEPSPAYVIVRARDEALRALLWLDRDYAQARGCLRLGEPPERIIETEPATW